MILADLEPEFLKLPEDLTGPHTHRVVDTLSEADGIAFLCPQCFKNNGGNVGTHLVVCWKPQVPQTVGPKPGRWNMEGKNFNDLTLKAGSSSVALTGGCRAHFFVKHGNIQLL